ILNLGNDEDFARNLNTHGFEEVETKHFGMGLFLRHFAKKQIKDTPQRNIRTQANRKSGNRD
ncbi:MAG: hypothetical protein ACYSWZ_12090, partial [Planctomycetota bacterium]